ncbi:hypothetical protein [uncultured Desulfosarcina sp.]|uniref:hypothetical protein n=1 Tax=uncultured Desulfosarcina sp. TaxID=218289 RepID=UPI0029C621AA|nr:hypothetical protein [uncultured Desulfosarcina sp.]
MTAKKKGAGTEPAVEADGTSDEMSAEEQDAFNKIMGEIEGSGDSSSGTSEDASETDDGTVSEEDFAAELEKVVQEAESDAADESGEADSGGDAEEELDEDQQKAFESIMAQIGGGEDSEETPSEDASETDDGTVSEEDFAAELEKVVQEAESDAADESGEADSGGDAEEELDEDQQKAFESIMAQIGGGEDSEETPAEEAAETDDGTIGEEDFAAELEKVAQEAEKETVEENEPAQDADETADSVGKKDDTDSDDALDTDQQEAFESIMAQIEGGKSEEDESEGELEVAKESEPESKATEAEAPEAAPSEEEKQSSQEEVAADVDEILKEAAVEEEEEETPPPDHTAVETAPESKTTEADQRTATNGDNKASRPDVSASKPVKAKPVQKVPPAGKRPESAAPAPQADIKFKPLPRTDAKDDAPAKKATALREAGKPVTNKWKKIALGASAVVLLLAALAGYRYWRGQPGEVVEPKPVSSENVALETNIQPEPDPPSQPPAPVDPDPHASDRSRLKTAMESLNDLRSQLLAKKAEIEELRAYYQAGIDAEINGILDMLKTMTKDSAAIADPRIGLGLSAIQRRDTYIRKLVSPVDELTWHSEELLYFSRRAELLVMMASKTSDIDIDGFVRESRELIDRHTRALEELNIDDVAVSPLSTEAIWNDITSRLPKNPPKAASASPKTDNDLISEQICDGNFSQKHKLTVLSPKTAHCLAQWKGKDLFLNALKQLEPEAARELASWKGEWLGLNGLEELSPEAAAHLSRWKGKGLSLNGLSRLSPRVVAILSEWQGDQIELVNVKHMAHWENPKTRLFLSEEMNRKRNAAKE